jgi:hypothetical protein
MLIGCRYTCGYLCRILEPSRSDCRFAHVAARLESIEQVPGSVPHAAVIDNVEISEHRGMLDILVGAH